MPPMIIPLVRKDKTATFDAMKTDTLFSFTMRTGNRRGIKISIIANPEENTILRIEDIDANNDVRGKVDINPNRQSIEGLLLIAGNDNTTDLMSFEEGILRGSVRNTLDAAYEPHS